MFLISMNKFQNKNVCILGTQESHHCGQPAGAAASLGCLGLNMAAEVKGGIPGSLLVRTLCKLVGLLSFPLFSVCASHICAHPNKPA